jgi:hypothetical protein
MSPVWNLYLRQKNACNNKKDKHLQAEIVFWEQEAVGSNPITPIFCQRQKSEQSRQVGTAVYFLLSTFKKHVPKFAEVQREKG